MESYKVKIPLDSIDVITGSTVVSGVTVQISSQALPLFQDKRYRRGMLS